MKTSKEEQMRILFDVYYKQCNNRRIEYTAQSEELSWIVMDGIELGWMEYDGEYQPIFMCGRGYEVDNVYYFKTFAECEKVWLMDTFELDKYIKSITN